MSRKHYLTDGWGTELKKETVNFRHNLYNTLSTIYSLQPNEKEVYKIGNVAAAIYKVNQHDGILYAHSQINYPTDPYIVHSSKGNYYAEHCAILRNDKVFTTGYLPSKNEPIPYDRMVDTEAKLLEEIRYLADQEKNPRGEIYLFTEFYPCDSCKDVIKEFQKRYNGNITVNVYFED